MEMAPLKKPAVLGLGDLSKLKLHNFDPKDAYRRAQYPTEEARRYAKKRGMVFKVF
jgi:hypothetical protein